MLPHRKQAKLETLTALLRLARASSAAAVTAVAVISFSPTLAPVGVGGIVGGVKATFIALLAFSLCLPAVGANKKTVTKEESAPANLC